MNEQQLSAVKQALEALECVPTSGSMLGTYAEQKRIEAITTLQSIISQDALDKMADNARELGLSYDDAIKGGVGIMLGGKRIDPASIYAEPKIGCVNHDCDKCKAVQSAERGEPVAHPVIAGALFDFMGWLTSRKETLILSSADNAGPAVEVITEFAKMRGLSLDGARVQDWQDTTPPAAQKPWVGLTDEEKASLANSVDYEEYYLLVENVEAKLKAKNELKEKNT
jgi:hypothetical protein